MDPEQLASSEDNRSESTLQCIFKRLYKILKRLCAHIMANKV